MASQRKHRTGRVLLIAPNLVGTRGGVNRIQPGLGIAYIASVLRRNGHEVFVRDTALEGYDNQIPRDDGDTINIGEADTQIGEYIRSVQPDIVGISVVFSNLAESARNIAGIVKKIKPDACTVVGGNHVTNSYQDYAYANKSSAPESEQLKSLFLRDIKDANIDYAMVGEAEFEFATFVDLFLNGGEFDGLENLISLGRTGEIKTPAKPLSRRQRRQSMEALPPPAWDLFNMERYFDIGAFQSPRTNARRILPIMVSRGCPEICTFCTTPDTWGMRIRLQNPKRIRDEINFARSVYGGIDEIQLLDDNITANIRGLYSLCDIFEDVGIRWCTPNGTKANYHMSLQPDYYRRMWQSGCYQITIACEVGNQRVMDEIVRKKLKLDEIARAVENAKAAGLFVHTFWIVGFPGESRREMEDSMDFAASIGADSYSVSIFSPLPGTPLYRRVVEKQLWWPGVLGLDGMTFRNSLVKVDGFEGPDAFESWVNSQNLRLNALLGINNPARLKSYEALRDERLIGNYSHQT